MNATFLLVTSAWLAGGQAPPSTPPATPPAAPPAAHVAPAPGYGCGGGCGSTCGCNDCDRPGLLDRLKARFHRDDCGCNTCAPAPACNECERPSFFERLRAGHGSCGSCGSTCNECERQGLFERFRGRFHRNNDCGCDSGCNSGCANGGCGTPLAPLPGKPGEPLKPPSDTGPMKLPSGDKPKDKDKETSAAPRKLDLTPTGGTRIIESGTKNPY